MKDKNSRTFTSLISSILSFKGNPSIFATFSNNINIFDFVEKDRSYRFIRWFKLLVSRQDKRLAIYLVCVGIATIFWFLNALNKDYTVDLSFPIRYTNLPKNKILVNEPPKTLKLQVTSHGFTLLRHKLNLTFRPLAFKVNDYTKKLMETTERSRYTVSTKQNLEQIADQLINEIKVIGISPDTIQFIFDRIIDKKVKVKPRVDIEYKKQFQLAGSIKIKPDSIVVSGPQTILDTLAFVQTKPQYFKAASELIQRNLSLEEIENLAFNTKRVVLNIPIEQYTESQMMIPVSIENKPDSINVKLFPNKVKVTFSVGLSRYSEVIPDDFDFSVNWEEISLKDSRLKINVNEVPPFVNSVKISPEELEYLIER